VTQRDRDDEGEDFGAGGPTPGERAERGLAIAAQAIASGGQADVVGSPGRPEPGGAGGGGSGGSGYTYTGPTARTFTGTALIGESGSSQVIRPPKK